MAVSAPPSEDNLTGLGATDAAWNAHHPAVHGVGASERTYGAFVPIPGAPYGGDFQWSSVNHYAGRITGYVYSLPEGTSEATAEQAVMAQLPPDATTTLFTLQHDGMGGTCAVWDLRSPTLVPLLGPPPNGDMAEEIGIELSTYDPEGPRYDPHNVDTATIGDTAGSLRDNC